MPRTIAAALLLARTCVLSAGADGGGPSDAVRASAGLANAIRIEKEKGLGEARPLFEAVIQDFGRTRQRCTTYRAVADAHLNPHRKEDLEIGKPAPENYADAARRNQLTWPVMFDGGSINGPIATKWRVFGWPTIYVLDAKGVVRYFGVRDTRMDEAVDAPLAEMKAER
jgi:hypothetical protein